MRITYFVMERTPESDSALWDLIIAEYRWLWLARLVARLLNQGRYGHFYVQKVQVGGPQ